MLFAAISGVLNGLFKLTALWKMPRFYTATILLLYSANDITSGSDNVLIRILYNLDVRQLWSRRHPRHHSRLRQA